MPAPSTALFLDRDGVVNTCPGDGYVLHPADFHFTDGLFDLMRWAAHMGWKRILVTNQQGVAKGLMSLADLDAIHHAMQAALRQHAAPFDAIYACTHLAGSCSCRKPSPEMIEIACRDHAINPTSSTLIGDADRDIEMARNALIGTSIRITNSRPDTSSPNLRTPSLPIALAWLQSRHSTPSPSA